MYLMQLVKSVLDELYLEIKGSSDTEKDKRIKDAINSLRQSYSQLTQAGRPQIDFSRAENRFAYIYMYTTAHADYVMQMFRGNSELKNLLQRKNLTVSSLGGGPGSDFLGILKYMENYQKSATVTCYLYDRKDEWGESWGEIVSQVGADFSIFPVFQRLDVTEPATWQSKRKFLKADLFMLIYFLSELHSLRDRAEACFDHVFAEARPGATFLFMDNNDKNGLFCGWFEDIAARHNVSIIKKEACNFAFGTDEEKTDLEPYFTRFGWPKRQSDLLFCIATKD